MKVATLKFWQFDKFKHSLRVFARSAVDSAKELWKGPKAVGEMKTLEKLSKHSGKLVVGAAALSTVIGVINAVNIPKPSSKGSVIDDKRKYVVD